jgi:hypothetical protein
VFLLLIPIPDYSQGIDVKMTMMPNTSRGCVKSVGAKFGNDQIFDMANFDEVADGSRLRSCGAATRLAAFGR